MKNFDYAKPTSLSEAASLYAEYKDRARLLLGGTDLIVMLNDGVITPDMVIDLKGIDELKRLEVKDGFLHIGAAVTFNELIDSELIKKDFPVIWESARTVASTGVRNRATLVGNICSAVPSADSAPSLLVREALVTVVNTEGEKDVPITEFFRGPRKTILEPGDIAKELKIPVISQKFGGSYVKLGRYDGEDLAQTGVATLALEDKTYRVAFCAVAPTPVRATEVEEFLKGKDITDEVIEEAIPIALKAISPISDVRASKEYRLHASGVIFKRSLKAAVSRMNGNGPAYGTRLV